MMRWQRVWWLLAVTAGVALVGLGVFLVRVGLERADKLGSVIGAFSGLIGLGLSMYGVILARRQSGSPPSASPESVLPASSVPPGQSVINSSIAGSNIQIGSAGGSIEIHRSDNEA